MKILFIDFSLPYLLKDSNYPVGGWAVELQTWLQGIKQAGAETGVLTWKGASEYVGRPLDFELLGTYNPKQGIKVLKYFYLYIPAMLRAARAFKPDVIIQACCGLNTGIMAFIANRLGVPFIYRVANDMDADERYTDRLRGYEQFAYRSGLHKARAILCQNQYQHDRLQQWFPNKPLHILHNPFDIERNLPQTKFKKEKRYIAWLGVFSRQKNMSLLHHISGRLPDVKFHIAGMESKTIDPETCRAIEQLKRMPNVHFVGYVQRKDVLEFLSGAVALLSTSHYEGFSNTFLEALVSGTPIIAPRRVDPDLIITNNKLGLTSEQDEKLSQLIEEMWNLEERTYETLAEKCRSYVLTHHDPVGKSEELMTILRPIVNGKNMTKLNLPPKSLKNRQ